MRDHRIGRYVSAIVLLVLLLPSLRADDKKDPSEKPGIRLAVLIVIDQMRGDYIVRWDGLFQDGGFRRLRKDGAEFTECHYPYAYTFTGPGHASLATGRAPRSHGIIANEWFSRDSDDDDLLSCVRSVREQTIGVDGPIVPKPPKKGSGASPQLLIGPTLSDALKAATGGKGKVVSLSLKDRSAVLPGGRKPDACYWADELTGDFVTSTYYRDALHPWVAAFNKEKHADAWFGKKWERLLAAEVYEEHAGPDDVQGESTGYNQGRTFPHPFGKPTDKPSPEYYDAVATSPFGNDLLVALTKKAIVAERLGADDVPDLLCLSFSSNDMVGHAWGPNSQEVLDVTLRTDRNIRDLLEFLDAKVGKDRYVVVLSADHGICPLPEIAARAGRETARVDPKLFARRIEAFLQGKLGQSRIPALAGFSSYDFYLNPAWLKAVDVKLEDAEKALAEWLKTQPEVQAAYSKLALRRGVAKDDDIGERVLRSCHSDRSGDVLMVLKPYFYLASPFRLGTTHGTPYPYDTHVPLLVYGPGVLKGSRDQTVSPLAAASILARALGIAAPEGAEAPVPAKLFQPTP